MQRKHTPEARNLWKQLWKMKKSRKAEWERELLQEVLRNNWHALQAVKRARKPKLWAGALTSEEGWQKRLKQHYEGIFKTQDGEAVQKSIAGIWKTLEKQCKHLTQAMEKWKWGTSTGPDGVALPGPALATDYPGRI